METTITYTEEQFKQSIIDTYKQQMRKQGNTLQADNMNMDKVRIEVFIEGNTQSVKLDKFLIHIEM